MLTLLVVLSAPALVIGLVELAYYPLALVFAARRRPPPRWASVSIVVPAYNEERVLANCVDSILATGYPWLEVVLVDDGSTDRTLDVMRRYARLPNVIVVSKTNAGKGAALNTGLSLVTGDVVLFVDADGMFTRDTIAELLRGFTDDRVGAVCGNDEPVNLDRLQTRLLALLTHGTAFVRRALAAIGCLTIVSGNIGAFRRDVLARVGGFAEGMLGEDLELTWRVHRAGYRVAFVPTAKVYAEVPSTVRQLWRQRVRWTRGHVQTLRMHRNMLWRGKVGWYLPFNAFAMLVAPVLQLLVLAIAATGVAGVPDGVWGAVAAVGLAGAVVWVCFGVLLDRAGRDLRFLYVLPVLPFFSVLMGFVTVAALVAEARGAPKDWNKLARSGVVSR
ncbi:glycosyltransferase [Actinophytocola algeriensis]|uniref:Cellulose synthase/poly-beta-1,6-N-acetylglucosamine synthase-like glycosyltransferase n=1 Tax=Actinophytocola algeriensis TaxID=1768010 RepID=A0A7W7VCN7_9PSEU|nr:glycosyltransferase family 2 protein [Actinophytocola algeriensis]MBB4905145.1 cellulose synthase/poly-beta-1,6-N-acetylglucosamine synthase-like glycosyltransferase [Actinophytocola algeriensis]MBE1473170.1 cellulose synthase/poly-beta-1,6-N-acetylglucosamine synthase-like glycosyltransferase [Actinophytocola algeriensis]